MLVAFAEDLGSLIPGTHMGSSPPNPVPGDAMSL